MKHEEMLNEGRRRPNHVKEGKKKGEGEQSEKHKRENKKIRVEENGQ